MGRVANRIRGAAFQLDGKQYHVSANDGNNSLHGGTTGWSRHVWTPVASDAQSVTLQLVSPDGDEVCGLPECLNAVCRWLADA